ncbi:hypothetical protein EDC19_0383 [Natranaerovirga hydrolytica]|uniref:Zn-dependent protease n=1 Tax=Natranaerovirga hydrolytica TaxID=680378 RepID=A0A4R1MXI9_9FIRM|nr:hypothetical protein [Natranaerovirga hydrolytica]TCK97977.1 hypothetical protein EDC19_0383 [Natranaerovirga hydrolytica]
MINEILKLLAVALAAIVVMYLHELPKSIAYIHLNPLQRKKEKNSIYKIKQYVDPLGLIFFITSFVGFSRPFAYRIKDKKTNYVLGIVGLVACLISALFFYSLYITLIINLRISIFFYETGSLIYVYRFIEFFLRSGVLLSIMLFFVNVLIPIPSFDIAMIIASKSPKKYFTLHQYEKFLQLLFIVLLAFNFFAFVIMPIENVLFFS